jgi:hypothetical protein
LNNEYCTCGKINKYSRIFYFVRENEGKSIGNDCISNTMSGLSLLEKSIKKCGLYSAFRRKELSEIIRLGKFAE